MTYLLLDYHIVSSLICDQLSGVGVTEASFVNFFITNGEIN